MKAVLVFPLMEKAINTYLTLGHVKPEAFSKLTGKVIAIKLEGVELKFFMSFTQSEVFVQSTMTGKPNLSIAAAPFTLLQLFKEEDPSTTLFSDKIKIEGDVATAQALQLFFKSVDVDWEYYFSLLAGDVVANESSKILKNGLGKLKTFSKSFRANVMEYLQEEKQVIPPKVLVQDFFNEVDTLRNDVARLEQRVQRLTMKLKD
jgi:ubiquinone biosynthesis protein UbiJ